MVSVLLSASVERFGVSRMQDFLLLYWLEWGKSGDRQQICNYKDSLLSEQNKRRDGSYFCDGLRLRLKAMAFSPPFRKLTDWSSNKLTRTNMSGTICGKAEEVAWWMEPLGSFPRVLNVLPREKIEGPPRDFLKANPRPHPRPDQRPKTQGAAGPEGFWALVWPRMWPRVRL